MNGLCWVQGREPDIYKIPLAEVLQVNQKNNNNNSYSKYKNNNNNNNNNSLYK